MVKEDMIMTKGITKTKKTKIVEFMEVLEENSGTHDTLVIRDCKLMTDWDRVVVAKKLQAVKELVFKNCIFNMDMAEVEFFENLNVSFENCTFQTMAYMTNAGEQKYKKCKFNHGLNIRWAGDVIIEDSDWKDVSLDISYCNSIYLVKCKGESIDADYIHNRITLRESEINNIKVNRCVLEDLNLYFSNVNELRVNFSNIESMGIYVNSSKKNREIQKLHLYKSGISCGLDLDVAKIKLFSAEQTIVTGNFHYVANNIKDFALEYTSGIIPPSNSVYLYKKCWYRAKNSLSAKPIIVKLEVPETAKRVYCENYKVRVSEAKVVELYNLDGKVLKRPKNPFEYSVYSGWDSDFKYKIGEIVTPESKFDEVSGHCGSGIHGFINFNDAVEYDL